MKELTRTKNNVIRYFHVLSQCIKGWQGNNGELFINFLDSFFFIVCTSYAGIGKFLMKFKYYLRGR